LFQKLKFWNKRNPHIEEEAVRHESLFFILSPSQIARYLVRVFETWGFCATSNRSTASGSIYIKLAVGMRENPRSIHVRVSDHQPTGRSRYDYDVNASFVRENCCTYLKLVSRLARQLGKPIPPICEKLLQPENYKRFSIRLQQNRRHISWRSKLVPRFSVP
jgi:hypothetical protein